MDGQRLLQINSLSCRLKAAQRELSMFRSGEAYAKLREDYQSIIRRRDAEIKQLRKERDGFSFSRKEITGKEKPLWKSRENG